ncbi:hypothetical protein [Chamaesiphon sp. OTE_8_metabat_110]|nr:hypothetical protein [Chamaesiphon sp. OTE_8_metabat_110]
MDYIAKSIAETVLSIVSLALFSVLLTFKLLQFGRILAQTLILWL